MVCGAGFSGSMCGTFQSVAPALPSGSGRVVFTLSGVNLTAVGSISAFIGNVKSAVAASAGVAESRVTVVALTPIVSLGASAVSVGLTVQSVGRVSGRASDVSGRGMKASAAGDNGFSVTVDIAAGGAGEKSAAAALVSLSANPPTTFGSVTVPAGSASCPGLTSCASADPQTGDGGEAKNPRISDGAAVGIALAGLIAVIAIVAIVWYFCSVDAPSAASDKADGRVRGSSQAAGAVELQVR